MSFVVLILDDEPWQLSWVTDIVGQYGGSCTFVATFDDAKAAFLKIAPAIAIVDVRIGEATGAAPGPALGSADPTWVGLRFLRYVRVDLKSASTCLMVYTGIDREDLQQIAESYRARFFTKFESADFRRALIAEFKKAQTR